MAMGGTVLHVEDLALCTIPKVASTAMRRAVLNSTWIDPSGRDVSPPLKQTTLKGIGPDQFVAGFMRHPLDRLVSVYTFFIVDSAHQTFSLNNHGMRLGMPFKPFVEIVAEWHMTDGHTKQQAIYLPERLDFAGTLENIDTDWARLQERFPWLAELRPANQSPQRDPDWRTYYDPASLALAEEIYAEDLERYAEIKRRSLIGGALS